MPTITDKIRTTWFKCMESIGTSAANLADNAKQKLNEINMEARRKEVVADLPSKLLQMWKDGAELPEELNELLGELNTIEEDLAAARAARLAKKMKPAITDGSDAEVKAEAAPQTTEEAQEAAEDAMDEANDAVEEAVDAAEDKLEEAADSIGDTFRSIFMPQPSAEETAEEAETAAANDNQPEVQYDYN